MCATKISDLICGHYIHKGCIQSVAEFWSISEISLIPFYSVSSPGQILEHKFCFLVLDDISIVLDYVIRFVELVFLELFTEPTFFFNMWRSLLLCISWHASLLSSSFQVF